MDVQQSPKPLKKIYIEIFKNKFEKYQNQFWKSQEYSWQYQSQFRKSQEYSWQNQNQFWKSQEYSWNAIVFLIKLKNNID